MRPATLPLLLALIANFSGGAISQSPLPKGTSETVFRTTTHLVLVDVVVTKNGKAVHHIDRSQFHVFEDGREQHVRTFDEHQFADSGATGQVPYTILTAALPSHTYSNVSAYPEGSANNLLLLDELNTPKENREFLRKQIIEYLGSVPPGTSLAVFILNSNLRMVQGFGGDIGQAIEALKKEKPEELSARLGDRSKNPTPDFDTRVATRHDDPLSDERPQLTLDAVLELAQYLSLIPGRKNLIWFAGTFPAGVDPRASLSSAHVAVYPVDARGMMAPPGSRVSYLFDKSDWTGDKVNEDFSERIKAEHATMEQFAEQTGGQAYFNTNGLKEAMARAVENGSSYYTIGYTPPGRKPDGKFRSIKVHVDGPRCDLGYRRGYFSDTLALSAGQDPGVSNQMTESVVHGAPPATEVLFRARILPATGSELLGTKIPTGPAGQNASEIKGPAQHTIVDLTLDPHSLALSGTDDGIRRARVEFMLAAYDGAGKRVNYLLQGMQLSMERELYQRIMTEGIPVRLALDLPLGQSFLRIAVFDLDAGKAGSLEVPLNVVSP